MILYVVIAVMSALVIYLIVQYNGFVKTNNMVKEAFSTMDVYLKKRWDLIPNLIEVVKGYAKYEKETFNQITSLRTNSYDSIPMDKKINVNQQLGQGITKIMAIAENYPELKANENFANMFEANAEERDNVKVSL